MFFEKHQKSYQKIIFLISIPRSHSTIFFRMMQARGDMDAFMEPGHYAYYKSLRKPLNLPEFRIPIHDMKIDNFPDLITHIEKSSKQNNVFIKEMSVAASKYLTPGSSLISNENAFFFFLLRNPKNTIISRYKKLPTALDDRGEDTLSCHKLADLYQTIHKQAKNRTFLINSDDLLDNPSVYVKQFCEQAGIPFIPESLRWDKLEPIYEGQTGNGVWKLSENCIFSQYWHDFAVRSTCFDKRLRSPIKTDSNGEPTFEEISENHRLDYYNFYKAQVLDYQLLMKEY